ncbi:uncharacterized protein N7473_003880 [Penicillium subrubescens]|uniref:NAD(P)-binding domain-containing protein n=1 Tax=Penicillium subrubescens TaxID=1316194 RepID=A0A1Q5U9U3_9EURO|nr:uncharacterized protein N7473_003880 [Penicillium subrubescens]KAJ5906964.1 hypothetical protein N7473_003880 [Penicillium subrubescens]OKP09240.1 hypothetical protein PENSUB_5448 [Penicillium subrubescens]
MSAQTIAFLGATGGCTNACLSYTLLNGHNAIALARNPEKLTTQLLSQPGLTQSILDKHLRVIQGDARDIETVMKTLIVSTTEQSTTLVTHVISGVGGTGQFVLSKPSPCAQIPIRIPTIPHISIPNPHITEESTSALLAALGRIADERFTCFDEYAAVAPRVTIISSTGIKKGVRDVPMLCKPLYAALEVPHKDKMQMERLLTLEQERKESLLCGGHVIVRPSLLGGDHRIAGPGVDSGYARLRVGTERRPEVGYTVGRALVGEWIYREVVKGGGDRWVGEGVILTK